MSDSGASTELLAAAKDAAANHRDYYALLDISPDPLEPITRDTVQRAWRKRSLRYHPDKAGAAFDKDKWEEFGLARDVLASDEARAAYDGARSALLQRQRERDLMNSKQRRFAEELERAEGNSKRMQAEERTRREKEDAERAQQAQKGRAYMEERKRKLAEAEERETARTRREDDARDDKIRELEDKIADKARRRAEKKAKKEGRKTGVALDNEVEILSSRPVLASEQKPPEPRHVPTPAVDVQMSEHPIQYWETQWPKTKARLLTAQAKKEGSTQERQAAAA